LPDFDCGHCCVPINVQETYGVGESLTINHTTPSQVLAKTSFRVTILAESARRFQSRQHGRRRRLRCLAQKKPGGIYTPDDYATWLANFGETFSFGSGSSSAFPLPPSAFDNTVPEPATLVLGGLVVIGLASRRAIRRARIMEYR
jgi:hypothetical protein